MKSEVPANSTSRPEYTALPAQEAPIRAMALPIQRLLQLCIILALPPFFVLLSVRLVTNTIFLQLEYNRPNFPEDLYGFSTEDRLKYGSYGVNYLLNDEDIDYLANLEINGQPAFNQRELKHMEDVKVVTQRAFQVLWIVGAFCLGSSVLLVRSRTTHKALASAWRLGGILTLLLIGIGLVAVVVSWNFFFDTFHEVFFADGTWQFHRSDTLIRLYPEQFWFDAAITIGILTISGALLAIIIPTLWERRQYG
ncbi:MAG: TIGR01906 family membrane protein [Phototrophicales bacterium]|nr:MAG: TIGR01906 family membrane protein [Phototrophicales bacterium]